MAWAKLTAKTFASIGATHDGISTKTMEEHYKLYLGYRDMVERVDRGLTSSNRPDKSQFDSAYSAMLWGQNYGLAGAHLHELYFANLTALSDRIMLLMGIEGLIEHKWGNKRAFEAEFHAAGLQARGWVVLGVCAKCPEDLRILTMDAHDLGAVYGYCPLLVIDTYEHAYWMDFGTDKGTYLHNVLGCVEWTEVDRRYTEVHPPPKFGYGALPPEGAPLTAYSYERPR